MPNPKKTIGFVKRMLCRTAMLRAAFMKHFVWVFMLFFVVAENVFAQTPGYLGKKRSAGYGLYFSPAIYNASPNNRSYYNNEGTSDSGKVAFNRIHELFLENCISTDWMAGFSMRFFRTVYDNQIVVSDLDNRTPASYYKIRGISGTVYLKHFKKKYVAPWGRYSLIGLSFNRITSIYNPYMHVRKNLNGRDTLLHNFGDTKQTSAVADLVLGLGKSRIVANKIIIDYGVTTQVVSFVKNAFNNGFDESTYPTLSTANYIVETTKARIRGLNAVNGYFKVGYLF